MTSRRTVPIALVTAALSVFGVTSSASAKPSITGAAKAVEKRVRSSYSEDFRSGDAQSVTVRCRLLGTYRGDRQYLCTWKVVGDPFEDARYDIEWPSGKATAFAKVKGKTRYRVEAFTGDDL